MGCVLGLHNLSQRLGSRWRGQRVLAMSFSRIYVFSLHIAAHSAYWFLLPASSPSLFLPSLVAFLHEIPGRSDWSNLVSECIMAIVLAPEFVYFLTCYFGGVSDAFSTCVSFGLAVRGLSGGDLIAMV